jgi:Arc/MetJ-type ribon-helix-helix transcriptional regulator
MEGMIASKIAVSLPKGLVAQVRRAVNRGRAESVSAYVASALVEKTKLDELAHLLDEMLAETGGPLSSAERQSADEVLGAARSARRRRST